MAERGGPDDLDVRLRWPGDDGSDAPAPSEHEPVTAAELDRRVRVKLGDGRLRDEVTALRDEVEALRAEVAQLRAGLDAQPDR